MIEFILNIDTELFIFINSRLSNPLFDAVMPVIRNKMTWVPLYVILLVVMAMKNKKQAIWIILFALATAGLADLVSSHFFKPLFARPRPCENGELLGHINLLLSHCSGANSFPSSHAANHFALGLFLGFVYFDDWRGFLLIGGLWAALISFAQVYVGVHYPLDVVGGAILGGIVSILCFKVYQWVSKKYVL